MKDFEKVKDALDKWHSQQKQLAFLDTKWKILKEELDTIGKESLKIQREKCKYTDIIVENHKYFANDDRSMIVKVIGPHENSFGIEFHVSEKGKKDRQYFSSSLGILNHGDNPITEEEYKQIYDTM